MAEWATTAHAQAGHQIVLTEVIEDGTIVDWIDASFLPGGGRAPTPTTPHDGSEAMAAVAQSHLRELSGPPGAVPYIRPRFEPYTDGRSGAASLAKYIEELPQGNPFAGSPASMRRLYTSVPNVFATNYGAVVYDNSFFSGAESPTSPDFVITEVSVWTRDATTNALVDQVGVVHGQLPGTYTASPVVAVEYFLSGTGKWVNQGSFGLFVQTSTTAGPGSAIVGTSTEGGTQLEAQMAVWYVDNDPVYPNAWWVSSHGITLGYIPASSFTSMTTSASTASHYVEAYDADHETSTPSWMTADMGSGTYPSGTTKAANYSQTGYLRRPAYWASKNGGSYTSVTGNSSNTDARCYSSTRSTDGGSSWNPTYWFGGEGGNDSLGLCATDPGCAAGILSSGSTACCDPRCGTCGGSGCGSYWNDTNFGLTGGAACCAGNINASTRNCSASRAPCKM